MTTPTSIAIDLQKVCVLFGRQPTRALEMLDAGASREEVQAATGDILGVHDCTLTVQEGEIVVLMGLSGSGKSTLLRAVNGLNTVARGSVQISDGEKMQQVNGASPQQLRLLRTQRVAMVFQQFGLLPWRNVAENFAFGLEIAGVPLAECRARVAVQLEMVNLQGWGDCQVSELSGGMQQRVGLARAFATECPILLMDEPFSALDPLIRVRLQEELLNLQKRLRRTILFVSHDLDEALKLGNRVVIMEGGRIVQSGTPEEIILSPATDYVADFVAHMNPLKTLRAKAVMRPLEAGSAAPAATTTTVTEDTILLEVLRKKQTTPGAITVMQGDTAVGTIETQEIHQALLRQQ